MTTDELARLLSEGRPPVVIDVQSAEDYSQCHLPGAINIPLEELTQRAGEFDPHAPAVFY